MCSYQAYHHFYLFFPHIDHTNSLILVLLLDLHSLIVFLQVYKSLCKSLIRNRLISSPDNAAAASCHSFENSFPKFKWLLAKTYCWKQTLFHWSFTSNCSIFFFKWANSLKLQHQLSMYTLYPLLQRSDTSFVTTISLTSNSFTNATSSGGHFLYKSKRISKITAWLAQTKKLNVKLTSFVRYELLEFKFFFSQHQLFVNRYFPGVGVYFLFLIW